MEQSIAKETRWMAFFLTLAMCIQRISIAAGNICFGISILVFLYLVWKSRKSGQSIWQSLSQDTKRYIKVLVILVICLIPSVIFSYNPKESIKLVAEMWLYRVLPMLMIVCFIRNKQLLMKMLGAFLVAEIADSMVAMYQSFALGVDRPWGFGSNTLNLPGILVFLIPITIMLALEKSIPFPLRRLASITLVFTGIAIILGKSRGAWLLLTFLIPFVTWKYIRTHRAYMIGLILVVLCGVTLFATNQSYQQRLYSTVNMTTDRSNADRVLVWQSAIKMIVDHPVVGVGPAQFKDVYNNQGYVSPENTQKLAHTHNNVLEITTESGLLGGGALVLCFLYLIIKELRLTISGSIMARMRLSVLLGVMLFGMIDYTLDESTLVKTMWFIIGILLSLDDNNDGNKEGEIPTNE